MFLVVFGRFSRDFWVFLVGFRCGFSRVFLGCFWLVWGELFFVFRWSFLVAVGRFSRVFLVCFWSFSVVFRVFFWCFLGVFGRFSRDFLAGVFGGFSVCGFSRRFFFLGCFWWVWGELLFVFRWSFLVVFRRFSRVFLVFFWSFSVVFRVIFGCFWWVFGVVFRVFFGVFLVGFARTWPFQAPKTLRFKGKMAILRMAFKLLPRNRCRNACIDPLWGVPQHVLQNRLKTGHFRVTTLEREIHAETLVSTCYS